MPSARNWWHSLEQTPRQARSFRGPAACGRSVGRWPGKAKRGGARVIYYHHSEHLVFLLAAYAKNEKAHLSRAARNAMKRLVPILVAGYGARK